MRDRKIKDPVYDKSKYLDSLAAAFSNAAWEMIDVNLTSETGKRIIEACNMDSCRLMIGPNDKFPYVVMHSFLMEHNPNPHFDTSEEIVFWSKNQFSKLLQKQLPDNEFKNLMEQAEKTAWEITIEDGLHIVKPIKQVDFLSYKDDVVAAITVDYEAIAILNRTGLV